MKTERMLKCLLVATLGVSLLYIGFSQAEPFSSLAFGQDDPFQANVGFGAAISDAEIQQLLQRHNVKPRAAFMWTSGLTGTHRTYQTKSTGAFLQEARAKTVETLEKSLQGNQIRLRRFVEMHTEDEIIADDDLQMQARSLLHIRAAFKASLTAAQRGEPLIFSMEVSGDPTRIERLGKDNMVRTFERAKRAGNKIMVPHTPKPEAYQEEYLNPDIQAMSARELYQWIALLVTINTKEGK